MSPPSVSLRAGRRVNAGKSYDRSMRATLWRLEQRDGVVGRAPAGELHVIGEGGRDALERRGEAVAAFGRHALAPRGVADARFEIRDEAADRRRSLDANREGRPGRTGRCRLDAKARLPGDANSHAARAARDAGSINTAPVTSSSSEARPPATTRGGPVPAR
jgi:hypothetical protein